MYRKLKALSSGVGSAGWELLEMCIGWGQDSHRDEDRRVYEDTPAKARITHSTARQSRPRAPSSDTPLSDRIPKHHEDAHDHLSHGRQFQSEDCTFPEERLDQFIYRGKKVFFVFYNSPWFVIDSSIVGHPSNARTRISSYPMLLTVRLVVEHGKDSHASHLR